MASGFHEQTVVQAKKLGLLRKQKSDTEREYKLAHTVGEKGRLWRLCR